MLTGSRKQPILGLRVTGKRTDSENQKVWRRPHSPGPAGPRKGDAQLLLVPPTDWAGSWELELKPIEQGGCGLGWEPLGDEKSF